MTNSLLESLKRITARAISAEPGTRELSFLEKPTQELGIETLISGFDGLLTSFKDVEQVAGDHWPNLQNTQALKTAVPELPTITEMMNGENGDRVGMATLKIFKETARDFKSMVNTGSNIADANPEANILELDSDNPEALLFHREANATEEGLVFGTTLHILEMYLNKRFAKEFASAGFDPRKDWLLDMSMEQMIINETRGKNKNLDIHNLFNLVNNQLGWIEGYPNIDPELRKIALIEPLKDAGFMPTFLNKETFAPDSLIVDDLVEFDRLCFGEHPTGSETNGPPLLTREDVIAGIQQHENEFLILNKGNQIVAALQYFPRAKDQSMHIMSLAVHPEARGKGIAKKIKSWIEVETEERGINKLTTRIDPNNKPIIQENFKRQFVVTGARNKHIEGHPNDVTTIALTKLLNAPSLESILTVGVEPIKIPITNHEAIDKLAKDGFRGTQIENSEDGSTTLIMHKMNEAGLAAYPYAT